MSKIPSDPALTHRVIEAHGILASVAWAAIMPLGAIMIRLVPSAKAWLIHSGIMLFGLLMFTSAFGLGVWDMNEYGSTVSKYTHSIIGTVMFAFAWLQPFLGLLHHLLYRCTNRRSLISAAHVYFGRSLILLGMVNGGVGLLLDDRCSRAEKVVYGTLVGAVWVTYTAMSLGYDVRREIQGVQRLETVAREERAGRGWVRRDTAATEASTVMEKE